MHRNWSSEPTPHALGQATDGVGKAEKAVGNNRISQCHLHGMFTASAWSRPARCRFRNRTPGGAAVLVDELDPGGFQGQPY